MANPEENPPNKLFIDSSAPITDYNLPDELIHDILSNLPVKSLLRFRAVSKAWLSIISSPNFVDSHLDRAISRSETEETVIGLRSYNRNSHTISLLHLHSPQRVVNLELPYSKDEFSILPDLLLAGSCNGIVCAVVTKCRCKYRFHWSCERYHNQRIYLWNPATKHSKLTSPHTIKKNINISSVSYGFGFDSISNDFKVVRVVSFNEEPTRAEVYSANKNVWRHVECEVRAKPDHGVFDALVRGVLYSTWSGGVLRFDLNKEVFNYDISFPLTTMTHSKCNDRVIEYKNSIALLKCSNEVIGEVCLWKADDACHSGGSKGSWTWVFRFNFASGLMWLHGYLNSGHILLKDWRHLWFLYDINKKKMKEVPVRFRVCQTFKYMETLVSIKGSIPIEWKQGRMHALRSGATFPSEIQ